MVAFSTGFAQVSSPEQARERRRVAEALLVGSPAKTWADGLSNLAGSLTGTVIQNEINNAETEGAAAVGGLFGGLSSASPEQDIIAAASHPWATDSQRQIAAALLGQNFNLANDAMGGPSEMPASVREWEYYNALSDADKSAYLGMKRSVPFLDLGPEFVRPDPVTGGVSTTIAKDNYQPAFDAALGGADAKTLAEVKAQYDSLASKLPGLNDVVEELGVLADKATYTQAGVAWDTIAKETGQMPSEGALARTEYIAKVDNQILPLLRDTFGAAFTVKEGDTLRATLGDPNKSPAEKKLVLKSFIEQKTRDLEALANRLPGNAAVQSSGAGAASDTTGWDEVPGMPGVKIRAR